MKLSSIIIYPINLKVSALLFFLFVAKTLVYCQTDWVSYLMKKDKGYMAVTIDLDFNDARPNYKNLLIVGTKYYDAYKNGFPNEQGLDYLYTFSDSTSVIIDRLTKNRIVGIVTYQGTAFDIFYVKDTTLIRDNLPTELDQHFRRSKTYIYLKKDRDWDYYFNNIFPENADNNLLTNHQYLFDLVSKGDDLSGLRKVNHWISFKNTKRRLKFINRIKPLNFAIDSINFKKERKIPYELVISRKDSIKLKSISQLTQLLQLLIDKSNGTYEGWGTEIINQD